MAAAGLVSAVSTWLVIHATGSHGPDIPRVASSPVFILGITAAFGAAVWAARAVERSPAAGSAVVFGVVMAGAVLLRLMAVPAAPALSDDAYRYLWDGLVQAHGISPYAHAPAAPELDGLATPWRPLINNPDLPTIYPPVSQAVFLLAALAGGSLAGLKLLLVLFDLGTVLALAAVLRRRGLPAARVVIYAWSPLAVVEIGWNGHQDAIGVFLLALAAYGIVAGRGWLSMAAGGLSGAAKYIGWLVLPAAARNARRAAWLAAPAAVAVAYLPYLPAGTDVFGSLPVYLELWRFNDSIFAVLASAVARLDLTGWIRAPMAAMGWLDASARWETSTVLRLTEPLSLAKGIAAVIFVAFAVRVLRRPWKDPLRIVLALLGAALLLSPTLHPWYLLWIAPLMAVLPRVSWIWLTWAAMVFSYPMMAAKMETGEAPAWLAWLEYAPFFVMLAVESARRRLWEMDGEGWSRIV